MKRYCLFLLCLLAVQLAPAQYFTWGTESFQKWKIRSTPHINVISPLSQPTDTAFIRYFDSAAVYQTRLMPSKQRRLNIVLHPNTLLSNGFVAPAPIRSELFTIPSRDFYPGYWPQQLAWHEMRHYAQTMVAYDQMKTRFGFVFGEYLAAGFMGLVVPSWFIEGDATASETAFLNTGRGRSPSFSTPLLAQLSAMESIQSYDNFLLGSDKNYMPNQYLYGYWMVASAQKQYGAGFWPQVYAETFMKSNFGMFPRTFKEYNKQKMPLRIFHHQTLQLLRDSVNAEINNNSFPKYPGITTADEYASYRFIMYDGIKHILAYKQPLHGEACFVSINGTQEKTIHYPGLIHDESFAFDGRYVYYCEYRPHPRREMIDYSRLCRLDVTNGKVKIISSSGKDLLPAVSPHGNLLAVCSYEPDGTYQVRIQSLLNGQTLGWATFPYHKQPVSIAVNNQGTLLYMIMQTPNARQIVRFDATTKSQEILFSSPDKNISNLILTEDALYFSANLNGNDEIYRLQLAGGTPECLTNTRFGAAFPVPCEDELYFSEMTDQGYQWRRTTIQPVEAFPRWKFMYNLADTLAQQTSERCDSIDFQAQPMAVAQPYSKGKHLIHVHSWGPFTIDPSSESVNPGIQFDSQNMLSTFTASVFSGYNLSTATIESGAQINYEGFLPILSLGYTNYIPSDSDGGNKSYNNLILSASLPLVFTRHAWTFRVTPRIESRPWSAVHREDSMVSYERHAAFLSLSASKRTNSRNMYPRLGAFFGGSAMWQSYNNEKGTLIAATGGFWLPGVFRHDGFRIRGGYEMRDTLALPFTTAMSGPRNYNLLRNPIESFVSNEYATPLLYPDVHLGSLIFLKRINGMISYDYSITKNDRNISSIGIHLMTDVHFLRLYAPVRLVFSEYYMQPANRWDFQFGLSYDLYAY